MVKPRELSHAAIQRAVFQHLRERGAPTIFAFHPKNEGADMASGRMGGIQYGLGMEPGIPDVIVIKDAVTICGSCWVYALELKKESERNYKPTTHTERQATTQLRMRNVGCVVGIAFGLDEALQWLESHELLIGKSQ